MPVGFGLPFNADGGPGGASGPGSVGRGGDPGGGLGGSTPKPEQSPASPTAMDIGSLSSETGRCVPVLYGTGKVAGNLLERYNFKLASNNTPWWIASHAYSVGDLAWSNGNTYVCTTAGTSAAGTLGQGLSGTGSGITDNTAVWSYAPQGYRHLIIIGLCEGQIYDVRKAWRDKTSFAAYTSLPHESFWIELDKGTPTGLARPNWFIVPPLATPYANTAVLMLDLLNASDSDVGDVTLEVMGVFAGASSDDANPADIVTDILTHTRRGVAWPSGRVDSVSTGSGATSYRNYCTAFGLNLSWLIDSQTTALQMLSTLMLATNTDPVWTNRADGLGGMLKFVPRGDQALTANGVTFTPVTTPVYNLGPDDFVEQLQVRRVEPALTFNSWPVEYIDRAGGYVRVTVDDVDMSDVDLRGLRRTSTTALPMVMSPDSAVMLSRILAQRSLNLRNTYTFRLGWRYLLLEPTDVVTITDPVMGLSNVPVKIISIEEDQQEEGREASFTVVAEDYPVAVSAAAKYTPQAGDGFVPQVPTSSNGLLLLPGQVPPGTIPDSMGTRGANVDNIWPNPTSETNPPDGILIPNDGSSAEWDWRVNAGAGAYAGKWVREITPATPFKKLVAYAPAHPGDRFTFQARVRATSGSVPATAIGDIIFFDSAGNSLGAASYGAPTAGIAALNTWYQMGGPGSGGGGYGTAPAGTVKVGFFLYGDTAGGHTFQYDSIYARRAVDTLLVTPGTAGQLMVTDSAGVSAWAGDTAWTAPTLLNSWVNFGAPTLAAGYFKDANGFVHLRGGIKNGVINAAAFTLPVGYRPSSDVNVVGRSFNGVPTDLVAAINITSAGNVLVGANNTGANNFISLDGISFDTR